MSLWHGPCLSLAVPFASSSTGSRVNAETNLLKRKFTKSAECGGANLKKMEFAEMKPTTVIRPERSCLSSSTPHDRQESIRRSWSQSEKNRRRRLAAIQQLRLFGIVDPRLERTAC
jgi:hypothetical protein